MRLTPSLAAVLVAARAPGPNVSGGAPASRESGAARFELCHRDHA